MSAYVLYQLCVPGSMSYQVEYLVPGTISSALDYQRKYLVESLQYVGPTFRILLLVLWRFFLVYGLCTVGCLVTYVGPTATYSTARKRFFFFTERMLVVFFGFYS